MKRISFSCVIASIAVLALSSGAFAQQAPLPNELQPIVVRPPHRFDKKEIKSAAHVAAEHIKTARNHDGTFVWAQVVEDLWSERNQLVHTDQRGFEHYDEKAYAQYLRNLNDEAHKSGALDRREDIAGYATAPFHAAQNTPQPLGIEIFSRVDNQISVIRSDGRLLGNVWIKGKHTAEIELDEAPAAATNGDNDAQSEPEPYLGIGVVIKPSFRIFENVTIELLNRNGIKNITDDMVLDATARAAAPSLPADASNEQKSKALDDYVKGATTYSDEVVPLCNQVFAGGPADQAGIEQFDVIVQVNDKSINGLDAAGLANLMKDGPAGSTVKITVLRTWGDGSKSMHNYTVTRGTVTAPKQ